jgi:probable HAF family extracellular repeat protein
LLVSAHVVLSDDGHLIAATLATELDDAGVRRNALWLWRRTDGGAWSAERIVDRAVYLADMNDQGIIVGHSIERGKRRAFVFDRQSGGQLLKLPTGRNHAWATDVNCHGQVVGTADDPPGPDGATQAFIWQDGHLTELPFPIDVQFSTANAITDDGRIAGMLGRAAADGSEAAVEAYVLMLRGASPDEAGQ